MVKVLSFQEAITDSERYKKRRVLLGNGFSIACRKDIFIYKRLFEQADFSDLSPSAKNIFEILKTFDFEKVIKVLRDASKIISIYGSSFDSVKKSMLDDAEGLREVLVRAIASSHPERPGDISDSEYAHCRDFLAYFDTVYTLNYDLLLYWTVMHTEKDQEPTSDDGFRKPDYDYSADYVTWDSGQSHGQDMWYLHGALHVFDTGTEIQKYTWVNTGIRLIEQIRDALKRDYFPLFVAEGTSKEKLERIRHSDYLAKAYRSFQEIGGALFIFGHSLADNDEHFIKVIEKGRVEHLYIGLFGDVLSPDNLRIIGRAERMKQSRRKSKPLEISYYDSATAKIWG